MKSKIAVVEGTISDIREVTSTIIVIDGKNYFTFTYPTVKVGDCVRLTLRISGGFRDVINIKYLKNIKEALK